MNPCTQYMKETRNLKHGVQAASAISKLLVNDTSQLMNELMHSPVSKIFQFQRSKVHESRSMTLHCPTLLLSIEMWYLLDDHGPNPTFIWLISIYLSMNIIYTIYIYIHICVFVNWNWAYQIQKWLKIVPFSLSPFLDRKHDKVSIDPDGWDIQTIPNQGAVNIMLPKLKMFRSCGCASGDTSAASTPRSAPTREPKICTSMAIQRTWENRGTRDVHHE